MEREELIYAAMAVSYTHLDVYKRQGINSDGIWLMSEKSGSSMETMRAETEVMLSCRAR